MLLMRHNMLLPFLLSFCTRTMVDHVDATEGSDVVRGNYYIYYAFNSSFFFLHFTLFLSTSIPLRAEIDEFHTSDSAFDFTSAVSKDLQIRLFELLGMSPYQPPLSDGFQVSTFYFVLL